MDAVGKLEWREGVLTASSANLPTLTWSRPADLAEARLECDPPIAALDVANGMDLLQAAFAVVPFVREPLPQPTFGDAVTPPARDAFLLFLGLNTAERADAFRVMRGEPGEFLVCARRYHSVWKVGGFTSSAMSLTVRFEDLWSQLPQKERYENYLVEVCKDGDPSREVLTDIAPDARIMLDLAENGGFTLTFWPVAGTPK